MSGARWLFVILIFWLGATIWCNALEPAKTELVPSELSLGAVQGMADPILTTAPGAVLVKITPWITKFWKALIFDYGIFTGWLVILRIICILFTVASLYYIADIIWKIRSILLGQ